MDTLTCICAHWASDTTAACLHIVCARVCVCVLLCDDPRQPSLAFQLTDTNGLTVKFEAQSPQQFQEWWPALTQLTRQPSNASSMATAQAAAEAAAQAAAKAQAMAAIAQGNASSSNSNGGGGGGLVGGNESFTVPRTSSWTHHGGSSSFTSPGAKRQKTESPGQKPAVVAAAAVVPGAAPHS